MSKATSIRRMVCPLQEPTKHQYDYDAATTVAFLLKHGLEKDFKVGSGIVAWAFSGNRLLVAVCLPHAACTCDKQPRLACAGLTFDRNYATLAGTAACAMHSTHSIPASLPSTCFCS